jgi:hypothetical protein
MNHTRTILIAGLCLFCLFLAVVPVAADQVGGLPAGSSTSDTQTASGQGGQNAWATNPQHIAAMQAGVAYRDALGQARMNGAITYIGSISNGAGTSQLSSDETQFTTAAASVQSMNSESQIKAAISQMGSDQKEFASDAKSALGQYNGNAGALKSSVNASVEAQSATLQGLKDTWWSDRQTARMDVFSTNDQRRNAILTNLTAKGIDDSQAQAVETQIQQEGTVLNAAFTSQDENAVKAANQDLATLTQQFAGIVKGYRTAHRSQGTSTVPVTEATGV